MVWLLGSLCQVQRLAFDPALILQQFPPPYSLLTLIEAARALGFRLGESATPAGAALAQLRFPCVAFLRAQNEAATDGSNGAAQGACPVLLIKADTGGLLYFVAGEQAPRTVALAEAQSLFEPELLLVAYEGEPEALSPDDPAASGAAKFGFRWFAAELYRHKRVKNKRKNKRGQRRIFFDDQAHAVR
jgi:subfamily B ATP-binding cassette protein HlyB/CyaB